MAGEERHSTTKRAFISVDHIIIGRTTILEQQTASFLGVAILLPAKNSLFLSTIYIYIHSASIINLPKLSCQPLEMKGVVS